MRGPNLLLLLLVAAACKSTTPVTTTPPRPATIQHLDPWQVYQELEALVAAGRADEQARARAYRRVRVVPDDGSARYAFVRAALAGRLAETRGVKAVRLVKETETWARRSLERDRAAEGGAARRLLATLYVMAPQSFLDHGDSETGLEMLEEMTQEQPEEPLNHLRLAQAYIHLGDPAPAGPHLCSVVEQQQDLRADDRELLASLVDEIDEGDMPCEPSK